MRILLPLVLVLLFTGCFGKFKDGEAYFRNGEYEKAIKEFNRVLFVSITDVKSLHLRARAYEELEQFNLAKADYEHILRLDPKYAQAHAGLGKLAWKKQDFQKAERHFLHAAMHDPNDYDIMLLLSRAMIKNQRFKSAEGFLQTAIELKPEEPTPHFYMALARGYSGDGLGVVTSLNHYLLFEPDNVVAHYNRGFALMKLGFKDWAIEDFDEVLRVKPDHYEAMARRAVCMLEDEPRNACQELKKAADNGNLLGKAYYQNKCQ